MADFYLTIGADVKLSYDAMSKDISEIIQKINESNPQVRVGLELDRESIKNFKAEIADIHNSLGGLGRVSVKPADTDRLNSFADGIAHITQNAHNTTSVAQTMRAEIDKINLERVQNGLASVEGISSRGTELIAKNLSDINVRVSEVRATLQETAEAERNLVALQVRGNNERGDTVNYLMTYDTLTGNISRKLIDIRANLNGGGSGLDDATRAIEGHYDALTQLATTKTDITLDDAGYFSPSGNWDDLAQRLNNTEIALNLVKASMMSLPLREQEKLMTALISAENKYRIALEQTANKEREAAAAANERAAKSKVKDDTRAIKEYYSLLAKVDTNKTDVVANERGEYFSPSGNWSTFANELNSAKTAYDGVLDSMSKLPLREQEELTKALVSAENEYYIALERIVDKEREAAAAANERAATSDGVKNLYRQMDELMSENANASNLDSFATLSERAKLFAQALELAKSESISVSEAFSRLGVSGTSAMKDARDAIADFRLEMKQTGVSGTIELNDILNALIQMRGALNDKEGYQNLDAYTNLKAKIDQFAQVLKLVTADGRAFEEALTAAGLNGSTAISSARDAMLAFKEAVSSVDAEKLPLNKESEDYKSLVTDMLKLQTEIRQNASKWGRAKKGKSEESYKSYIEQGKNLENLIKKLEKLKKHEAVELFDIIKKDAAESAANIKNAGEATQTLWQKFGSLSEKFGTWFSISQAFMTVYRKIREMVTAVIELDTAMTELRKVTDETENTYNNFLERASVRIKTVGASLKDTVYATADFARLGYALEDAEKLADAALIYKNIGDDISDIGVASEHIISTMQAFDISADNVLSIIDKFNEVSNKYAISSSGIGEALLRSAAAMHAANNSLDETIALAAAANTVIQNPDTVGTALKTVSMYLRAAKTEAEEAGESTEGMASSVSELRDEILSLTGRKVDIQIDNDTFKGTYQILKELSAVWDELSEPTRSNITELVGGKRNSNVISALLENFSIAEEAMRSATESANSALIENEKHLASTQGKIDIMKASFEVLAQNVVDGEAVKLFVEILTIILELLNAIAAVIKACGGLKTVLLAVAATLLIVKGGMTDYIAIMGQGAVAQKLFRNQLLLSSTAMQASMPIIGLAIAGITMLVAGLSAVETAYNNQIQAEIDAADKSAHMSKEVADLTHKYLELSEAIKSDSSVKEELSSVESDLIDKLGIEKSRIQELTEEYDSYTDAIKRAAVEKLQDEERNLKGGINAYSDRLLKAASPDFASEKSMNHIMAMWSKESADINQRAMQALANAGYIQSNAWSDYGDSMIGSIILSEDGYDLTTVEGITASYERLATMLDVVSDAAGFECEVYRALNTEYTNVSQALTDYDHAIDDLNKNLAEQLMLDGLMGKEIPSTKEEFDEYRRSIIKGATESDEFIGSRANIISAIDDVLSSQPQFAKFFSDIVNGGISASGSLKDLAESIEGLKSAYSLASTAEKEMNGGEGLSVETIKALADITEDYIDYLYEENGVIKLNIEAWKEFSNLKMEGNISDIKAEIARLEEEKKSIDAKWMEAQTKAEDNRYRSPVYSLAQYTADISANAEAIEAAQQKLDIYATAFDNIVGATDAYSSALRGFSDVADSITSVSDALATVAEIQNAVANGFTISLEKALEFAKVYPEILNGAEEAAGGQITLSEETVNAFIKDKEGMLKASIDAKIVELEGDKASLMAKKEFAMAQLELAKSAATGEAGITKELAIYRIQAGEAIAQELIDAGIDEADAYKLACAAMAQNSAEFNTIVGQVCTDVSGNIDLAAYEAAQSIYVNVGKILGNLDNVIDKAHNAAKAIAGSGKGIIAGNKTLSQGSGGVKRAGMSARDNVDAFMGVDVQKESRTSSAFEDLIADIELDIKGYEDAISQIDGQISTLKALRNKDLDKFLKDSSKSGGSGSKSGDDSWFEKEYALHQHLMKMDAESVEDYLEWLNSAYQRAYKEGIISLEDYQKYQVEVFTGLRDLFKDYLGDVEHEISMRGNYDIESKKIISLYESLISAIENEIAVARAQGLDDTNDYVQELQSKWQSYSKSIKDIQDDVAESARDALDELVEYRIDMIEQDVESEKDALDKKLDYLKDFYDKQKEMLEDQRDEEKYLEEQTEKRKSVSDLQAELTMLDNDNSAWAQRRRLELQEDLAAAQDDLNDFEKEHALDLALDTIENSYNAQEEQIQREMDALDERLNDPEALYNKALAEIKNNTDNLYQEMLEYNRRHGSGNDDDIIDKYEEAYKALLEYKELNGEDYNGVVLANATGFTPNTGWDTSKISGTNPDNISKKEEIKPESADAQPAPDKQLSPEVTDDIKKKVAAAIWNGGYGWGKGSTRKQRLSEVFGDDNGIQALVNKGVGKNSNAPGDEYTYLNMRKKFKGYASGTKNAVPGIHPIDELGAEYLFTSGDGNRYRVFSGGEKVLNAKATNFLYEFANGGGDILKKIVKSALGANLFDNIRSVVNHNEINMGNITVQGNADMRTVSEIRRAQRDNITDMLKSLNKLNK